MDKFEILSIINKGRINEAAVYDEIISDDIPKSQRLKQKNQRSLKLSKRLKVSQR